MRRWASIAVILAAGALPAAAQRPSFQTGTGNIPASVTSLRPGNSSPGIPASVTSLRPTFITRNNDLDRDFDRDRTRRHRQRLIFVPLYYPTYPFYNEFDYPYDQNAYAQPQQPAAAAEPEAPAQTVFENRPGYQAPPVVQNSAPAPAAVTVAPQAAQEPPEPVPQTVLIFKDGHQLEIGNYVIVGDTLYNLSGAYRSFKIALGELDLKATVKANEERGLEFHLPSKKNPA